jgi:hypothetical protein
MKPEHQEKVGELIDAMASTLRITAQRLYRSGAIDPDRYSVDEYALAKLLVTAAMYRHRDDYSPRYNARYVDDLKNLEHF